MNAADLSALLVARTLCRQAVARNLVAVPSRIEEAAARLDAMLAVHLPPERQAAAQLVADRVAAPALRIPGRKAVCHPERPHAGRGLCATCYHRQWRGKGKAKPAQPGQ